MLHKKTDLGGGKQSDSICFFYMVQEAKGFAERRWAQFCLNPCPMENIYPLVSIIMKNLNLKSPAAG
jgi:hypothetical protein